MHLADLYFVSGDANLYFTSLVLKTICLCSLVLLLVLQLVCTTGSWYVVVRTSGSTAAMFRSSGALDLDLHSPACSCNHGTEG